MDKFKTLLLDADDTLFDFNACAHEALTHTFKKYGYQFNDEIKSLYETINLDLWKQYELGVIDKHTVIYTRFGKLFHQLGIDNDGIEFEDDYQRTLGQQHFFIRDALEVVQYLYSKYDLYIVTNGVSTTQRSRFKLSGLEQYMKEIFVSEEVGYQKPRKEFFDYCFQRIEKITPKRTMIIGDSLSSDIQGGNNAGIATCWLNLRNHNNTIGVKVDYEIQQLKDLLNIL